MSSYKKDVSAAGLILGGLILFPLLLIPAFFLDGFVVTKLWNWFVMNQFDTIHMHYALGLGLSILVGFMARSFIYKPKETDQEIVLLLNFLYLGPLFTLLIGWIVQHWV